MAVGTTSTQTMSLLERATSTGFWRGVPSSSSATTQSALPVSVSTVQATTNPGAEPRIGRTTSVPLSRPVTAAVRSGPHGSPPGVSGNVTTRRVP